jgi:hypothetical protein
MQASGVAPPTRHSSSSVSQPAVIAIAVLATVVAVCVTLVSVVVYKKRSAAGQSAAAAESVAVVPTPPPTLKPPTVWDSAMLPRFSRNDAGDPNSLNDSAKSSTLEDEVPLQAVRVVLPINRLAQRASRGDDGSSVASVSVPYPSFRFDSSERATWKFEIPHPLQPHHDGAALRKKKRKLKRTVKRINSSASESKEIVEEDCVDNSKTAASVGVSTNSAPVSVGDDDDKRQNSSEVVSSSPFRDRIKQVGLCPTPTVAVTRGVVKGIVVL